MKLIFHLLIFLINITLAFGTEDLKSIKIIAPISYYETKTKSTTLNNYLSPATITIGNWLGKTDLKKKLADALIPHKTALNKYFTNENDLDNLVDSLVSEANNDIVKGEMNDDKAILVYKFFGNKLISKIFDQILEKEGVANIERRQLWVQKLLTPFNDCISQSSNAIYSASHCMLALTASIVPNVGLAIVYETSRTKLTSLLPKDDQIKQTEEYVKIYKSCLPDNEINSKDVEQCTLKSIKLGVLKVSDNKLTNIINVNASSVQTASKIRKESWTLFNTCIENISSGLIKLADQFKSCIDQLTLNTGVSLVDDKIKSNSAVLKLFSASEVDRLAKNEKDLLQKCVEKLIANDSRIDGILDTTNCQENAINSVTYKVMIATFKSSSSEALKSNENDANLAFSSGKNELDKCWANNLNLESRNDCIRRSVITFADNIANSKLITAIPSSLINKQEIISSSLESLRACLRKNLPENISSESNTNDFISKCSDSLTMQVALIVAESEVRKALQNNETPANIEQIINSFVKKEFSNCIGQKPDEKIIFKCSKNLKVSISEIVLENSLNLYLPNKNGIDQSIQRNEIKNRLIANLKSCLDESSNTDKCSSDLLKDANKTIVLASGKTEIRIQLNTSETPSSLVIVENAFINCMKTELINEKLTDHIDNCNKNYAIEFARKLGNIKLKFILAKSLGDDELKNQAEVLAKITTNYDKCLDNLHQYEMKDALTDKIGICTKDLTSSALGLVRTNLKNWMSSHPEDAKLSSIKLEFAMAIPCLSVLLPPSPYKEKSEDKNINSILKVVAQYFAQYIEYSPDEAKLGLQDVLQKMKKDLQEIKGTDDVKIDILNLLYQNGALNQFLKSFIRGKVKDAFALTAEKDLSNSLKEQLLSKNNFDSIFNGPDGKMITAQVFNDILKPLMIKNENLDSPLITSHMSEVTSKVVELLVFSPHFGEVIIKSNIQAQIDNMNGITYFFAKAFYGNENLNWEKVRLSKRGKIAEDFIKSSILIPKFSGKLKDFNREQELSDKARDLVTEAVTEYEE